MSTTEIPNLSTLVFLSIKPLIRVLVPAGVGLALQRAGVLPGDATRSSSVLLVNFFLPCLLFSKIVPAFTPDNVPAIGPIILLAFFYQALPFALGFFARAVTPTPRRFRWGVVSACMYGNWGDLPSAVVLSITSTLPFNPSTDGDLALAYVAIFILVTYISYFPLQGIRILQIDYRHPVDAALELRYEEGEFGTARKHLNRLLRGMPMAHELEEERQRRDKREDKLDQDGKAALADDGVDCIDDGERAVGLDVPARPRMSSCATQTGREDDADISPALLTPPAHHLDQYGTGFPILEPVPSGVARSHHSAAPTSRSMHPRVGVRVAHGIWVLIRPIFQSPPCVALLSALVISLVPTLRALFVPPKDGASFHPTAPDGDPPLAVLYDTAKFVGGASIPTGLVVLGASMGKLQVPRPIGRLPLASIVSMSVIRLVIQPIVGFFLVRELVNVGMVSAENKVLRFVMVTLSCVPTATLQVTYSILFAPPGQPNNSELVAAHLILQYIVWAFSSVILTAFSLNDIF